MKSGHAFQFRALAPVMVFILAFAHLAQSVQAASTDIADVPMAVKTSAKPNIMFMIDNSGSMQNIVPDTPYNPNTTYISIASCTASNLIPSGSSVEIRISDSKPWIRWGSNYELGTTSGKKCFDPMANYPAKLNADDNDGTPSDYLGSQYTGNYLNWYFNVSNTTPTWTSGQQKKPGTQSRMEIARTAGKSVIDSFQPNRVRVGLFTYNGSDGGSLREVMGDLDAVKATAINGKIDGLSASGMTPLAETLADIGKYFVTGYTGDLTLHPGQAGQTTRTVSDVFPHAYSNGSGVGTPPAPSQYYCQKSFAVLMTDGRPQYDRSEDNNIGTSLLDYDGDCSGSNASQCVASPAYDRKVGRSYESNGSDYLDDVALALHEIDLRPDLTKPTGYTGKNNVKTYMIGFADEQAKNDPLMQDTATNGGGQFLTAGNAAELVLAFQAAADDILGKDSSATAVAVANAQVTSSDNLYQSSYNSGTWSGDLTAYPLNTSTGRPI